MARPTSILIVGAGPVGLSAAVELERRGMVARIIDQDPGPSSESRALAIHARTLEILEPSGMTERLLAAGNPIRRMVFREPGRHLFTLDFAHVDHRYNFVLGLPQADTERHLIEHLAARGVAVEWGTRLTGLTHDGGSVRCSIEGRDESYPADIVIGADGAHSTVRHAIGIGFDGESWPQEWGLADVRLAQARAGDEGVVTFLPGNILAYFPFTSDSGRYISDRPDIGAAIGSDGEIREFFWRSTFRISYRQVSTYQDGRVFLAGDAAHIHSPVGGRGMNLGIEDAATLAWLIEAGRAQEYTRLRWPIGRRVLRFTHQQTRQVTSRSPLLPLARRHVAPPLLRAPIMQRLALGELTGLRTPRPPWLASRRR
jgi:2-polyprenyl-6-methoxyphenol hydroxylase-like FAD-dependent oxidoreductase